MIKINCSCDLVAAIYAMMSLIAYSGLDPLYEQHVVRCISRHLEKILGLVLNLNLVDKSPKINFD